MVIIVLINVICFFIVHSSKVANKTDVNHHGLWTIDYGLNLPPLLLKKILHQSGAFIFTDAACYQCFGVCYLLI